jgi:hypothetical protein
MDKSVKLNKIIDNLQYAKDILSEKASSCRSVGLDKIGIGIENSIYILDKNIKDLVALSEFLDYNLED